MITFKTKKEEETTKELLKSGKKTPFWNLILKAVDDNIEALRNKQNSEEISELPAEEYKLKNEIIKDKINFLTKFKGMPDDIISWLGTPESKDKNFDPYGD